MYINSIIKGYEIFLLGHIPNKQFESYLPKESKTQCTYTLIKYAIKNILHYTPQEAVTYLTYETLEKLKLMFLIDRHIEFVGYLNSYEDIIPSKVINVSGNKIEVHQIGKNKSKNKVYTTKIKFNVGDYCLINSDDKIVKKYVLPDNSSEPEKKVRVRNLIYEQDTIRYILSKCYPEIKFNEAKYALEVYKKALNEKSTLTVSDDITDDYVEVAQIPKRFFKEENNGRICAITCLTYVISRYLTTKAHSIDELYKLFGEDPCYAKKILKRYKLYKPLKDLYGMSPISFLHNTLRPEQRNEFLFRYYKFKERYKIQQNINKRQKNEQGKSLLEETDSETDD